MRNEYIGKTIDEAFILLLKRYVFGWKGQELIFDKFMHTGLAYDAEHAIQPDEPYHFLDAETGEPDGHYPIQDVKEFRLIRERDAK